MRVSRWLLAAGTVALFGTTLTSCSFAPEYAVTLNGDGHVQVEWCFTNSVTVHVRPDSAVLAANDGGGAGSGPFMVDLESAAADQWNPVGMPVLNDDTVIEVWSGGYTERAVRDWTTSSSAVPADTPSGNPTTAAYAPDPPTPELTVRVGDLEQGSYWYDGSQHSADEWRNQCDPDDDLNGLLVPVLAGAICFLVVIGVSIWAIISAVTGRAEPRSR